MITHKEVERKFLVKEMPDVFGIQPSHYERYILFSGKDFGLRIQAKNGKYEIERKCEESELSRSSQVLEVSNDEFQALKKCAIGETVRDGYALPGDPAVSIKVYGGKFKGLRRAEIQFESEEEAKRFSAPPWMGKEITSTPLGKDSKLATLTDLEFEKLLKSLT